MNSATTEEKEKLKNAWKETKAFSKQLRLNLKQLENESEYPRHWDIFLYLIKKIQPKSILDIGCGSGSYYMLCQKEFKDIKYQGIDFSENAIKVAKNQWSETNFFVKNLFDLTKEYVSNYDLIHVGALLDVLPNGDEALEKLLDLNAKNIIIGRAELTEKESYYEQYIAYDEISTCRFYHNKKFFIEKCQTNMYEVYQFENNFYLKRQL